MADTLSKILFFEGILFIILFLYSLTKHRNRVSGLFSIMCLSVLIYIIGYGFELRSINVEQITFFIKLEYFGSSFMTVFWLLFSYKFYFNKNASLRFILVVMIIPILTLFFCVTNEYHNLFYSNISVLKFEDFMIASLDKGPWYYVNVLYSYLVLIIGISVFYRLWRHSNYSIKTQSFLMFIGTLFPAISNLIYLAGLSPYGLDLMPFGFSLLAICYFIALFKYDFLDLDEIVRSVSFSEIDEGIIVVDDRNRLIDFNNAAQKLFGWLDNKNIGMDITELEEAKDIIGHKKSSYEIEIIQNGILKYYEFRVTYLKEKNKVLGSVFIIHDITKRKEMMQALDDMASYDSLTQVFNRRRLMEEAEKEAQRVKRHKGCLSVLIIDIDYFKNINDQYGHLAGDEVIKSIINSFKERLRSTDIIGRYGGDEFIIILPDSKLDDSLFIAEIIRKHIEDLEIDFYNIKIKVTVSIGVSSISIKNKDINILQVINEADIALYDAKNKGRNYVSSFGNNNH